jgi:hypothetical protein
MIEGFISVAFGRRKGDEDGQYQLQFSFVFKLFSKYHLTSLPYTF